MNSNFNTRYERRLLLTASVLNGVCAILVTVVITVDTLPQLCFALYLQSTPAQVFPCYCWRRDYLLYPNYNHLAWSYAAALAAALAFAAAAAAFTQVVWCTDVE